MRITPLLGLALALTACGTAGPSGAPAPDPINAAACLEFAFAADDLREAARRLGSGDEPAWGSALRHMDRAVQAANGEVEPLMDEAVLAAEDLRAAASGGRAVDAEAAALVNRLGIVEGACRRAGTPIEVPFPTSGDAVSPPA
ncbi:hypothetical protein [Herbidospora mongoliensis]|uniref:hypothetical protein n=1 Tax=Herbidospora mongoliensis TaxID=688067 RepID=UPI00082C85A2|nr:hypothetical protein [Herbidospora mongoliensis]